MYYPVNFGGMEPGTIRIAWMLILSAYVLIASAVPVWLILQGRDFINIFTLVGGMALLLVCCIIGGLQGIAIEPAMAWNVGEGTAKLGLIWPVLFITGSGAISTSRAGHWRHVGQAVREEATRRWASAACSSKGCSPCW
jgi:carbon starvation protein CstA